MLAAQLQKDKFHGKLQFVFINIQPERSGESVETKSLTIKLPLEEASNNTNCVKTFNRALEMCYSDYTKWDNLEIMYQSVSSWDELNDFIIKQEKPCIVSINGLAGTPPKDHEVLKNTQNLSYKCTVISTVSLTTITNISYPNSFSLSVVNQNNVANDEITMDRHEVNEIELRTPLLDKNENQVSGFGPYLDFQCPGEYLENETDVCAPSDFISGVVASLFIKAAVAGMLSLFFSHKNGL